MIKQVRVQPRRTHIHEATNPGIYPITEFFAGLQGDGILTFLQRHLPFDNFTFGKMRTGCQRTVTALRMPDERDAHRVTPRQDVLHKGNSVSIGRVTGYDLTCRQDDLREHFDMDRNDFPKNLDGRPRTV